MKNPEGEMYNELTVRVVDRIMQTFFTDVTSKERIADPTVSSLAYMAPRRDDPEELYAEYIKDTSENRKLRYGPRLPASFSYPYIQFEGKTGPQGSREGTTFTSSYGRLPDAVIDNDLNEWFIFNVYLLNLQGQGLKYEQIAKNPDPPLKELSQRDLQRRVTFHMSEEDSRFLPLTDADYGFIVGLLEAHDGGDFLPGEYEIE